MNAEKQPAVAGPVEPTTVRPCAWAHRYSPRGLLHTLRDNQQDAEDDAAIVGGSAHVVALYDERALDAAVAAERERCARVCDDEARIRTEAGDAHPEDSDSRGRCFAAARAAMNCATGIRGGEVV